ncbi:MAG: hypothetical protein H7Z39_02980, partial [Burkholderiaceae bacterium]|nr:hypothetical protein [Burkholderiaceae bacterium]
MKNTPKTLTLSVKAPRSAPAQPAATTLAVSKAALSYVIDAPVDGDQAPSKVTVVKKSRSRLAAVAAAAQEPIAPAAPLHLVAD